MCLSNRRPHLPFDSSERTSLAGFALSLAFSAALLIPLPAAATGPGEEVWITVGADVFATATDVFASEPAVAALPRYAEVEGVILTRVPLAGLEDLSARIHEVHRRCGGFVKHESYEEAIAALDRLRSPRLTMGTLPFAIDQPARVAELVAEVDEAQILSTITSLSTLFPDRYHAWAATHQSPQWIRDLWQGYAAARPEVTVELFSHGGITPQPSVILTIPGSTLAQEVVVIGAHQDSTRSGCSSNVSCVAPGADDDASGVATISEVIRVALASDFAPQRTVKFMAYAAEEVGLDGSDHIASTFLAGGVNVVAVLQQDMTGYTESATDIALINDSSYTDAALNGFLGDLLDEYFDSTLTWTTTTCGYACSDHASWQVRGYPASFAFEAPFGQHSPFIHTSSDTVASLTNGAAHAAKFARLASAFLVETSLDFTSEIFSDDFASGDTSAWSYVGSD